MERIKNKIGGTHFKWAFFFLAVFAATSSCGGGRSSVSVTGNGSTNNDASFTIPAPGGLLNEVGVGLGYMQSADYETVSSITPHGSGTLEGSDYRMVGVSVAAGVSRLSE